LRNSLANRLRCVVISQILWFGFTKSSEHGKLEMLTPVPFVATGCLLHLQFEYCLMT
jgi:hypothetical protein